MTNTILLVTGTKSWLLVCNTYLSLGNVLYYHRTIVQQCDGTVDGQRYSIGDCTAWSFHLTIMLLSINTFSLGHLLSYDCTTMRRKFLHYVHLSTNWNSICNMTVIGGKMTRRLEFLPYDGKEADVLGRTFTYFVATTKQWVQNIYGVQHYIALKLVLLLLNRSSKRCFQSFWLFHDLNLRKMFRKIGAKLRMKMS